MDISLIGKLLFGICDHLDFYNSTLCKDSVKNVYIVTIDTGKCLTSLRKCTVFNNNLVAGQELDPDLLFPNPVLFL